MINKKLPLTRDELAMMGWVCPIDAKAQRKVVLQLLLACERVSTALSPAQRADLEVWTRAVRSIVLDGIGRRD